MERLNHPCHRCHIRRGEIVKVTEVTDFFLDVERVHAAQEHYRRGVFEGTG
jgi:hypothetical protein